ncbi:hypothetical protein C4568_04705 [Candidatus Parcubacteria bacterium]|nr:MAG: hypothetical protein C4568_04705 [Candidatus Parcubacteria bacterium]
MTMIKHVRLVALFLIVAPALASAQFWLPGFEDKLTMIMTPTAPGPYSSVHLTLEGSLFNNQSTTVAWTVNGTAVAANADGSIDIQMGAAGEKKTIVATMGTQTVTRVVIPATVDLLVEATSYTPPFFKGRPLASPGTNVRALAIPHLGDITSNEITYTWRQNGSVIAQGKGRSSITLSAPPLFGADTISVEARSADSTYVASASVRLPGIDPNATLYINHPLVGIEYYDAIESGAEISDTEVTFSAVPYFISAGGPSAQDLIYEWVINGRPVPAGETKMNELTINAANSTGAAQIALSLSSSVNFFLRADQSWNVRFTGTGSTIPGVVPQSSDSRFESGI